MIRHSLLRQISFDYVNIIINSNKITICNKTICNTLCTSSAISNNTSLDENKIINNKSSSKDNSKVITNKKKKRHVLEDRAYLNINDIFTYLRNYAKAKFDETVEIAVKLGVDPRKPNQAIKGVASLPFGTGKKIRVCVFATGEDAKAALDAGADIVGSDDIIRAIQGGVIDFDRAIATPEMMSQVGKIGKILGPKGLMPNPKLGTVTKDVVKAVKSAKAGSVQFRVDKHGYLHAGIGKVSFSNEHILENIKALMLSLVDVKPEGLKGKYLQAVTISSTMGPGLRIDVPSVDPISPRFMLDKSALKVNK